MSYRQEANIRRALPPTERQIEVAQNFGYKPEEISHLTRDEMSGLIHGAIQKAQISATRARAEDIARMGLEPGVSVMLGYKGPYTVRNVFPLRGEVTLEGRRGNFYPGSLTPVLKINP